MFFWHPPLLSTHYHYVIGTMLRTYLISFIIHITLQGNIIIIIINYFPFEKAGPQCLTSQMSSDSW